MVRIAPLLILLLIGCGGNNPPSGPGGSLSPFSVSLLPGEITPPENAQVKLHQDFPEFTDLDGNRVYFSSSSGGGFFNTDSSYVNVNAPDQSNLNPSVWYGYLGSEQNLVDTVKVEIVDIFGNVLSWNFGLIMVH
jgi:hypothetical protein